VGREVGDGLADGRFNIPFHCFLANVASRAVPKDGTPPKQR
jgi:hypothetical protein